MNEINVRQQQSYFGSIVYMNGKANVTIMNSSFRKGGSIYEGGAFYIDGSGESVLNLT